MTKHFKRGLVVLLALAVLFGFGITAGAADKTGNLDKSDRTGDITIAFVYRQTPVPGNGKADFAIYHVGEWDPGEDHTFTVVSEFEDSGVNLTGNIFDTGSASAAWKRSASVMTSASRRSWAS